MRKNTEFGEFDEGVSEVDGGYGNIESAKSSRRWVIYMKKGKEMVGATRLGVEIYLE